MPKKVFREPRELGCPVSEFVRKSAREPSREASRADFRTIGQFGSARLSVGQTPKYRSDTFRTIGQFGQLGPYFGHSARLGLICFISDIRLDRTARQSGAEL